MTDDKRPTGIIHMDDVKSIGIHIPVMTPLQKGSVDLAYVRKFENISIVITRNGTPHGIMLSKQQTRELIDWFSQQEFEG